MLTVDVFVVAVVVVVLYQKVLEAIVCHAWCFFFGFFSLMLSE